MQDKSIVSQYLIFETPLGDAALIYRQQPFMLLKVCLPAANQKKLIQTISLHSKLGSDKQAVAISESLISYFSGTPIRPCWECMDMGNLTSLEQSVLRAVAAIPFGELRAYKEIAKDVGSPNGSRFVGNTVAKNPFPLLIPCHRVIRSDGRIGKFGGGTEMKQWLITHESSNKP